ncbi:MAG: hypothetical protein K1W26_02730 [Acetatifactor sp.]
MRNIFIKTGSICLMALCLSSCAASESGETAVRDLEPVAQEGEPFSVSDRTAAERGGEDSGEDSGEKDWESDSPEASPELDETSPKPEGIGGDTLGTGENVPGIGGDTPGTGENVPGIDGDIPRTGETSPATLPEEDLPTVSKEDISEKESASDPENLLAPYRRTVEESGDGMAFGLIYLDGDEIPELVVTDYAAYSVYTIRDGEVFCMVDSDYTVCFTYFERKGVIAGFDRWNGGGDEGGYGWYYNLVSTDKTLMSGEGSLLSFEYNAVYDENGEYTGEGVTKYFYMDQEIDEAAYREMMDALGIAEDGDIAPGDLVSAEEMLEML